MDLSAIVLPDRHPPALFLADVASAADGGVRTVWTYDHLTWPRLADGPWFGAVPLLAAAAMTSPSVRLGLQVATPNFRHPVPFAKELMTLDQLSGGRLDVGLGAGAPGPDAEVLGQPALNGPARMDRFVEWVGLLDRLLTQDETSAHGEFFTAIRARQLPGCAQQPRLPFTVAATGARGLAVAVGHGQAWVTYGPYGPPVPPQEWLAGVAEQSKRLDQQLDAAGRPRTDLRRIAQVALETVWPFASAERYADVLGHLTDAGFNEITVHWTRSDGLGLPAAALDTVLAAHR